MMKQESSQDHPTQPFKFETFRIKWQTQLICGHNNVVNSVTFLPDRKQVVSGSDDQMLHIYDVELRQTVIELT